MLAFLSVDYTEIGQKSRTRNSFLDSFERNTVAFAITPRSRNAAYARGSGRIFARFEISHLLIVEGSQAAIRSQRDCPNYGGQYILMPGRCSLFVIGYFYIRLRLANQSPD